MIDALLGIAVGVAGAALHVGALVRGTRAADAFLARHAAIDSERSLEAYRRHAAADSRMALGLLATPIALPGLAWLVGGAPAVAACVAVQGLSVIVSLPLAVRCQARTKAIRALPVEASFAPVAKEVTRQWIREPLVRVPARESGSLSLSAGEPPPGGELSLPAEAGRLSKRTEDREG